MQYSEEFKDLVMSGYYCGTLSGVTIRFPNSDHIRTLLETGTNNEELGKLLKEGSTSNYYFSAEEILSYLEKLNLNELRKCAEMAITRKHAYVEWQQKYNVQTQSQSQSSYNRIPTFAELAQQGKTR